MMKQDYVYCMFPPCFPYNGKLGSRSTHEEPYRPKPGGRCLICISMDPKRPTTEMVNPSKKAVAVDFRLDLIG